MGDFDFHVHTHYSMDSAINPRSVIKVAKKIGLSGIAVTDHNTIKGGLEVAKHNDCDDFFVLIGAEIQTNICEIIGLFLNEEISVDDPFSVIDEIEDQGGLAVLPHPFRAPPILNLIVQTKIPVRLIKIVNAIEVLNSRTSSACNKMAFNLATKMNKPMVAGSDAHFYSEIGTSRVSISSFDSLEDIKMRILKGQTEIEGNSSHFMNIYYQFLSFIYSRVRGIQ